MLLFGVVDSLQFKGNFVTTICLNFSYSESEEDLLQANRSADKTFKTVRSYMIQFFSDYFLHCLNMSSF